MSPTRFMFLFSFTTLNIFLSINSSTPPPVFDLAVVGPINFADGIGRQSISVIDMLKDDLSINYIPTRTKKTTLSDVPERIHTYLETSNPKAHHRVALLEDLLHRYTAMPSADIRIAYTMFESTQIPTLWVNILNKHFDAAVVPDSFLVDVYKNSGVTIPIFVLPIGLYLEEFLAPEPRQTPHTPFVFGNLAAFDERKNHLTLIKSFAKVFGNNPNVILKINGRKGTERYQDLKEYIEKRKITNIIITNECLSWSQYQEFLASLDCYVSLSWGEGFSIIPREALALTIPCILSNNTGQATICGSHCVYSVKSQELKPAYYAYIAQEWGYNFICDQNDVQEALKQVYNTYDVWLKKAHKGRIWVKQYLLENLKAAYLTLIKPNNVILGSENSISDGILTTNDSALYTKYITLLNCPR